MVRIMIADDHPLMRRILREIFEKESDLEVIAEASNGYEAERQAAQTQPDIVLMDLDMPDCDGFEATERVLARSPQSRVVIFTASQQEQYAFQAVQRGAVGYLTKDIEPDALVCAVRQAYRDELCMSRPLAARVLAYLRAGIHTRANIPANAHVAEQALSPAASCVSPGSISYKISFKGDPAGVREVQLPPQTKQSLHLQQTPALSDDKMRTLTDREREVLDLIRKGRKNREIADELGIAESTVHKHVQNIFEKLKARNRTEAIYLTHAGA